MSLSSLRRTYGNGTRHEVINRAIRAECPGGNQCLDSIAALSIRILKARNNGEPSNKYKERLAHWEGIRASLAAHIEAKHNVGPNTNRRMVTA